MNLFYITDYVIIKDAAMPCDYVLSSSECEIAAQELQYVLDTWQSGVTSYDPPFCYFEATSFYFEEGIFPGEGILKFNDLGTNTGPCTTTDQCVCRQNDLCAKTPCTVGQGDCDHDTECEGTLVCGHLNCLNITVTDCCALK